MSYRTIISTLPHTPTGWSIKALSDAVAMKSGDAITSANIQELGTYPVYGGNGLRGYCEAFNRDGHCSLIGRQGALCGAVHHATGKIFASEHAIVCKALGKESQQYITYVLHALELNELSEASAQPGLSVEKLRKLSILLPDDPSEQEAIAEALSDADALIEGLERLIAKKRLIKQGAMQDLLTAKRRLPGFSGEWAEYAIQDIAHVDPEALGAGTPKDRAIRYISLEDVNRGALNGWTETPFGEAPSRARRILRQQDVLLGTVRPNLQSHHLFGQHGEDWIGSTGFAVLRARRELCSPRYLFELIMSDIIGQQIDELIAGSNYPAISNKEVRKLRISLPSLDEQDVISEILGDLDAEIQALETRLEKARQVKEGMMQNLLTGRIRLV